MSAANVTAISGTGSALASTGAVYTWGANNYGQLGNGNTTFSATPVLVTALSGVNVKAVAGGVNDNLALTSTGAIYAWGYNGDGELGNGTTSGTAPNSTPVQVTGLSGVNVMAVAAGQDHSLALTNTGAVYAWGSNVYGALGTGNNTNSNTPVPVTGLSGVNVTAIATGAFHSLALTSSGAVYAWGYNDEGELGNGTTTASSTPVPVAGLSGVRVKSVAGSTFHSMALTSTGAVYAWGFNGYGELGNGTETDSSTPLLLSFPANGSATVVGIAAGVFSSFALESDGSLWAWGDNEYGQYGNGTTTSSLTPIEVYTPTGGYGISEFADSSSTSLAIVTAVPEPSSLLLVGVAGVAMVRRFIKGKSR